MADYVEIFQVDKAFPSPQGPVLIVDNFNLDIAEGEFVSLIGHSGCGKSTVLSMIAGLTQPTRGAIVVARREIDGPGPDRGVVFQSPCLLPWLTVAANVRLGIDRVFPYLAQAERQELAQYYLELVGLGDSAQRYARDISQGMQQRVGIARAFAIRPKMLLLDEPFGMLDSLTRMELQEVLMELLAHTKTTTLMVTHDVDEALLMSDRIVMMTNGPRAQVGEILRCPFLRPRIRPETMAHDDYYPLRERMLVFLAEQDHRREQPANASVPPTTSDTADSPPPFTDAAPLTTTEAVGVQG